MKIAMALLIGDKLHYVEMDENEIVCIGSDKSCDMVIDGIKKAIWRAHGTK